MDKNRDTEKGKAKESETKNNESGSKKCSNKVTEGWAEELVDQSPTAIAQLYEQLEAGDTSRWKEFL